METVTRVSGTAPFVSRGRVDDRRVSETISQGAGPASAASKKHLAERNEATERLIARRHDQHGRDHPEQTKNGDLRKLRAARGPERQIAGE